MLPNSQENRQTDDMDPKITLLALLIAAVILLPRVGRILVSRQSYFAIRRWHKIAAERRKRKANDKMFAKEH
jgi:hypothetical protein